MYGHQRLITVYAKVSLDETAQQKLDYCAEIHNILSRKLLEMAFIKRMRHEKEIK